MSDRMQEIFDTVVTHMLKQGEKSLEEASCKYRTEKDDKVLMCAAGCLIPDDKYEKRFEGCTVDSIDYFVDKYTPEELDLIRHLQSAHDSSSFDNFVEEFIAHARRIAYKHRLDKLALI